MEKVVERFIRYAKQHTASNPESKTYPSTSRQSVFLKKLSGELKKIGFTEVEMDQFGYVMASIPAKGVDNSPVVGFIAHVDTSPDFSGENVKTIETNFDQAGNTHDRAEAPSWDGTNFTGDDVAPGIYYYTIKFGYGGHTGKIAVIR